MTSIQSIDHPSVPAERILPRSTGPSGKAQDRQGAEITPDPSGKPVLSTGSDYASGPGIPRAHPAEAADNLLTRMPGQDDQRTTTGAAGELRMPPEAPGQLAVVLLSMVSNTSPSSDAPAKRKHTLDIMA